MATIDIVLNALKSLCIDAIYPNNTSQPSIIGKAVLFRKGQPDPVSLDPELRDGKARVNLWDGVMRDATRFPYHDWETAYITPATIVLTVSENTITLSGTVAINQSILVVVNNENPSPYSYEIQESDTLDTIAANLAALIPTASAAGAVITVSNAHALQAHMVTQGIAIRETQRQQQLVKICIRANTASDRSIIVNAINNYLSLFPSFELENDYSVRLIHKGDQNDDRFQKAALLQNMMSYEVEYSTIETQICYTIADPFAVTTRTQNPS